MGMYTEFHFNSELKRDTPEHILATLRVMLSDEWPKPDAERPFDAERCWTMLRCDSYYFSADTHSTLRHDDISNSHFLCIRCNLKNYDNEIEKFIEWITPWLDKFDGDFLGFARYEEVEWPTLIHHPNILTPTEPLSRT